MTIIRTLGAVNTDMRIVMRAEVENFLTSLAAASPDSSSSYVYSNRLYLHAAGTRGVHAIVCCISLPNGEAVLKLHAEIKRLVDTFLKDSLVARG